MGCGNLSGARVGALAGVVRPLLGDSDRALFRTEDVTMPGPQFTLRALLVAMLVVGAFFGGMEWQRKLASMRLTKREEELNARHAEQDARESELRGMYRSVLEKREFLSRWVERLDDKYPTLQEAERLYREGAGKDRPPKAGTVPRSKNARAPLRPPPRARWAGTRSPRRWALPPLCLLPDRRKP